MKRISLIIMTALTALLIYSCHSAPKESDYRSEESLVKTKIAFVNDTGYVRMIFRLDEEGKRELHAFLEPGEDFVAETWLTHPWLVTDKDTNALRIYLPARRHRLIRIDY
ncbi:MAG: hypothetical protein PQJ60_06565 [Spirochaetales bacterium]|nr:hypothetical protein [Spirochaetales bacterium]